MNQRPPHDLVQAVRAELAVRGRYHLAPPPAVRHSWLQLAFAWIGDRYRELLEALSAHIHVEPAGLAVAGDVLLVLAVAALAFVVARLLIALQIERSMRDRVSPLAPARSAYALYRSAQHAAQTTDYARAIRLVFAAAVTLLDLRGVVRDDESATVNELRRRVHATRAQAADPFGRLARVYTATVYADEAASERAWDDARSAYDRLVDALATT